MKRKFLEEFGLEKEVIDKIMAENGSDITLAKSEVEALKAEIESAKQQLTERDKQLEDLKKSSGDNAELQAKFEALQAENKAAKETYEAELKELKLVSAAKLAIGDSAHDADLIVGMLDKKKLILSDDGHIVSGLEEQLKQLRESKAFLFKTAQEDSKGNKKTGYEPKGGSTPAASLAKSIAESMNQQQSNNPYEKAWG